MLGEHDKGSTERCSVHCRKPCSITCCSESYSNGYNVLLIVILLILALFTCREYLFEMDELETDDFDIDSFDMNHLY